MVPSKAAVIFDLSPLLTVKGWSVFKFKYTTSELGGSPAEKKKKGSSGPLGEITIRDGSCGRFSTDFKAERRHWSPILVVSLFTNLTSRGAKCLTFLPHTIPVTSRVVLKYKMTSLPYTYS